MAATGQLLNPDGQHADAIFISFDFLGYADDHDSSPNKKIVKDKGRRNVGRKKCDGKSI